MTQTPDRDILNLIDDAFIADLFYADENEALTVSSFHDIADVNADIAIAFEKSGLGKNAAENGARAASSPAATVNPVATPRNSVSRSRRWKRYGVYGSAGFLFVLIVAYLLIDHHGVLAKMVGRQ